MPKSKTSWGKFGYGLYSDKFSRCETYASDDVIFDSNIINI